MPVHILATGKMPVPQLINKLYCVVEQAFCLFIYNYVVEQASCLFRY
ncbi:hypothetical protein [Microcoleus sp. B4-C1]